MKTGRPAHLKSAKPYCLILEQEDINFIEEISDKTKINKSVLLRSAVKQFVKNYIRTGRI